MTLNTPNKKYKKEYNQVELDWLEKIAKWKWRGEYKCRACGNGRYFEGKTPAARKCSICKHEESATANTPFHGSRLSIGDAAMMLNCLVDTYEEFNHIISSHGLTDKFGERSFSFRLRNADCRASSITIARRLNMHQRTVYLFLSRFMDSIPEITGRSEIPRQWFRGVSGDIERYERLYRLIEQCGSAAGIIEYMVTHTSKVEDE